MKYANIRKLKLNTNKFFEQSEKYGDVVVARRWAIALIRPENIGIKAKEQNVQVTE